MTRVRWDPHFTEDERWERLGPECFALHAAALSYVVRTLSDGFVSASRALTLTPMVRRPKPAIDALVADGMWQRVDRGYAVCDVNDDLRLSRGRGDEQPSRAYVEGERERAADRKARWLERQQSAPPKRKRNAVPNGVPNGRQASAEQNSAMQSSAVQAGSPDPEPADSVRPAAEVIAETRGALRKRAVDRARGVA